MLIYQGNKTVNSPLTSILRWFETTEPLFIILWVPLLQYNKIGMDVILYQRIVESDVEKIEPIAVDTLSAESCAVTIICVKQGKKIRPSWIDVSSYLSVALVLCAKLRLSVVSIPECV